MSKLIEINNYSDYYDCETCGIDYADGAEIFINDEPLVNITPVAHCYDGVSYRMDEILYIVLRKLGYDIKIIEDNGDVNEWYENKYQKV